MVLAPPIAPSRDDSINEGDVCDELPTLAGKLFA
jgi:hypothetical protein